MGTRRVERRITDVVRHRMREVPILVLQGPRSVGKSTVLAEIAADLHRPVINLDLPDVRRAVSDDMRTWVDQNATVLIDEYQRVPAILDVIKAAVDADFRPARFVLTGSTRFEALPRTTQTLTGRAHFLSIWPFTQGEIEGIKETFVGTAVTNAEELPLGLGTNLSRTEIAARLCVGGMPIAVQMDSGRGRWFDDYVNSSLQRDVAAIGNLRRGEELANLFRRLASQTAQVLNITAAANSVGVDKGTAASYVTLLEHLFLLHRLPAWGRGLRSRATAMPKVHLVDSGLAARLLRITPERLSRLDPSAQTEFGHLLESFVVNEILKQASWTDDVTAVGHWRTHDGHEVDLIAECSDGGVTGFEVKAGRDISRRDIKGLMALRDTLGDQFRAGIVLTTGDVGYRLDHKIYVCPITQLWSGRD
jgi:predicted AAA+ superfamily ATPase